MLGGEEGGGGYNIITGQHRKTIQPAVDCIHVVVGGGLCSVNKQRCCYMSRTSIGQTNNMLTRFWHVLLHTEHPHVQDDSAMALIQYLPLQS